MRAVLDPNVLISAILSRAGAPAELLSAWIAGRFDLVVSAKLLDELGRALSYPKIAKRVARADATAYQNLLRARATSAVDPDEEPPVHCTDPNDDYLIAVAHATSSALITGDAALLALARRIPVFTPRDFVSMLQ